MKLYHILYVGTNETIPMSQMIGYVFAGFYRDDVVSTNESKLKKTLEILQIRYDFDDEPTHFKIEELVDAY